MVSILKYYIGFENSIIIPGTTLMKVMRAFLSLFCSYYRYMEMIALGGIRKLDVKFLTAGSQVMLSSVVLPAIDLSRLIHKVSSPFLSGPMLLFLSCFNI